MGSAFISGDNTLLADFNYFQLKAQELQDLNRLMAHNLRGAAANIHMLTEVLEDSGENDDNAIGFTKDEIYHHLRQTSDAMLATLDRLMAMNKQTIELNHKTEKCNVRECVEAICAQMGYILHTRNVNIVLELDLPVIDCIKVYFESILYNLISNAIKYSIPNKLLILTIATGTKEGKPFVEVRDNGKGIDMEALGSRLFCPLYTSDTDGIHGLGLYLVKSHIEAMGGHISVHSIPGQGTTFFMQL